MQPPLPSRQTPDAAKLTPGHEPAPGQDLGVRATVLLRNEDIADRPLLPLDPAEVRSVAVIFPPTPVERGTGTAPVDRDPRLVPGLGSAVVERLLDAHPGLTIRPGDDEPLAAGALAAATDAAVVIIEVQPDEPHDAARHLPGDDIALIDAVTAANPRTVVIVAGGGTVVVDEWHSRVPGILLARYAGPGAGETLADILLGRINPEGHLPYPILAAHDRAPRGQRLAHDRWFGPRPAACEPPRTLYPTGFGLSYTAFEQSRPHHELDGTTLTTRVRLRNLGELPGRAVVQVHGACAREAAGGERYFLGATTVSITPGTFAEATIRSSVGALCPPDPDALRGWGTDATRPEPEGDCEILVEVGAYLGDPWAHVERLRV